MATTITININNQGQQQVYSPYPPAAVAAPTYAPQGYYISTAPQQQQVPVKTFFVAGMAFLVFTGGIYFFSNPFKMLVRIARMIPISYNQNPSRQYSEQFDSTSAAESDYPEYFPPAQRQESAPPAIVPTSPAPSAPIAPAAPTAPVPAAPTAPKLGIPVQKKTGAMKFSGKWAEPATKGERIAGYRISSVFGPRNAPVPGASTFHKGTDVGVPTGTPLYPIVLPGEETSVRCWVDPSGGGGNVATFTGAGHEFQYLHLASCNPGKAKAGKVIALSGATGRGSGPHLHIERRARPGVKQKVPVERGFVYWSLKGQPPQ